ncbi:MAG: hypothetical protein WKF37_09370 [Bryobacteraceae bacterium]
MTAVVLAQAAFLSAQAPSPVPHGTSVKPQVADYPVHAALQNANIGAEYMVRSFGEPGRLFITEDYLVVEVAIFPSSREPFHIDLRNFNLRLNGRDLLASQTPGMVAASLKYPDWSMRPQTTVQAGPVILGRPRSQPRFPDDNRPRQDRLPESAGVPTTAARTKQTRLLSRSPLRFPKAPVASP